MSRFLLITAAFVFFLFHPVLAEAAPSVATCGSGKPTSGFFYAHAKRMAFFAHPTARYLGARVRINRSTALVALYMRSRWTSKKLYVILKFGLTSYGLSRFEVLRYNAWVPPFSGLSLMRRFIVEFFKAELTKTKSKSEAFFIKTALNRLHRIKGRNMCLWYLKYKWRKY